MKRYLIFSSNISPTSFNRQVSERVTDSPGVLFFHYLQLGQIEILPNKTKNETKQSNHAKLPPPNYNIMQPTHKSQTKILENCPVLDAEVFPPGALTRMCLVFEIKPKGSLIYIAHLWQVKNHQHFNFSKKSRRGRKDNSELFLRKYRSQ